MRTALMIVGALVSTGACKKSGGGGGGGSSWLVGASGMMLNVKADGSSSGYTAPSPEDLNSIACRYSGEAWIAGARGTLLYTDDAGVSWRPQVLPTTADLRSLATQNYGPVFVAGNGVFLTSTDTGAHWTALGDGKVNFRAVAAAQDAETVLAVAEGGGLWAVEAVAGKPALVQRGQFAGARAVAVSADGLTVILAGDNLLTRSTDGGHTWTALSIAERVRLDDVRVDETGQAVAVGTGGAIAHVNVDGTVAIQHVGTADLHTVHIAEIGEDYEAAGVAAGDAGTVWITRDGGWSWNPGPNAGQTVLGVDQIGVGHR